MRNDVRQIFLIGRQARLPMLLAMAALTALWIGAGPVFGAVPGGEEIDWLKLTMGLFGGLALFLYGMDQMSEGLKAAAGESLKVVLAKLTTHRFLGALTGAFVTAVLNSSSVTTVLVVGFITAGIMTLSQSIGVIMGANIGSTVTAQIIAFNVTQYALLMVAIGFGMIFIGKREKTRYYGMMVMGLGLVFFGMGVMSEAMTPLRTYQPFLDLMVRMENPLLGILVGAVFTGLVQSSAATTGIAIVMASEGLMTLPAGIALAFGANIGTCVTALLAAIGKPAEAVRAAVAHIVFNVGGVLVWVGLIPYLAEFVEWISPAYPNLEGKALLAAAVPRQIANAHTVFNVANTLLFIGFTTQLARLVERLVPGRPPEVGVIIEPKFLDRELITAPSLALERVRFEIARAGEITLSMLEEVRPALLDRDRARLEAIAKKDDQVDILEEAILEYLGEIRRMELTDEQSREFQILMSSAVNLESLADVIETDLTELGNEIIEQGIEATSTTRSLLEDLYRAVCTAMEAIVRAVRHGDQQAAQDVAAMKDEIRRVSDAALQHQADQFAGEPSRDLPRIRIEMEIMDKLRRIYTLEKRIAKEFLPEELSSKA